MMEVDYSSFYYVILWQNCRSGEIFNLLVIISSFYLIKTLHISRDTCPFWYNLNGKQQTT